MENIRSNVFRVLAEQFSVLPEEISEKIGPGDLPAWDSLGQMQLIMRLEKEFNLQLSVEDVMSINNVKDIIAIVAKQVSGPVPQIVEKKPAFKVTSTAALRLPRLTSWGKGALAALRKVKQKNIVIITGGSNYAAELKKAIQEHLPDEVKANFIARPAGEPRESDILQLAEKLRKTSPDLIIAAGGGSSLDAAKLGWALYEYPDLKLAEILRPFSLPSLRKKASFIAVPTTFGSGSEASSTATFSKDGKGSKVIIVSHEFLPDEVILDPDLGKSMPLPIFYASAFDALAHAIEGYVSVINNPLVDPYAVYSVKNIIETLRKVQTRGLTSVDLQGLCYSAYYAGIVQNHCSVGLTHSLAHQLGGYGLSHGVANALFLTIVMMCNARGTEKYTQLAAECGFDSLDKMISTIDDLFKSSKILLQPGAGKRIVEDKILIVESAMNDITFKTNPLALKKEEIESLFNEFERKFIG